MVRSVTLRPSVRLHVAYFKRGRLPPPLQSGVGFSTTFAPNTSEPSVFSHPLCFGNHPVDDRRQTTRASLGFCYMLLDRNERKRRRHYTLGPSIDAHTHTHKTYHFYSLLLGYPRLPLLPTSVRMSCMDRMVTND